MGCSRTGRSWSCQRIIEQSSNSQDARVRILSRPRRNAPPSRVSNPLVVQADIDGIQTSSTSEPPTLPSERMAGIHAPAKSASSSERRSERQRFSASSIVRPAPLATAVTAGNVESARVADLDYVFNIEVVHSVAPPVLFSPCSHLSPLLSLPLCKCLLADISLGSNLFHGYSHAL